MIAAGIIAGLALCALAVHAWRALRAWQRDVARIEREGEARAVQSAIYQRRLRDAFLVTQRERERGRLWAEIERERRMRAAAMPARGLPILSSGNRKQRRAAKAAERRAR